MTLISLFGLWTGDNQYCQDNCEENADFSDLNVKAMEVNGRFYVGQNNSLDCRIWSSKKSEKVTYAPKESLDQQPWNKKVFCAVDRVFSSLFLAGWTSFMWPCQFLLHVYFVRARPSFAGAHGPLRNKHAKKNWLGHIKEVSPARKSEKTLSAAQKTFFFSGFLDLVSPLAHK